MTTHDWFTLGIAVMVGLLSWLGRRQFSQYDKLHEESDSKHQDHYRHAMNMELHETNRDRETARRDRQSIAEELIRHSERDDDRFESFDRKLDAIGNDIKALLRAAGKA